MRPHAVNDNTTLPAYPSEASFSSQAPEKEAHHSVSLFSFRPEPIDLTDSPVEEDRCISFDPSVEDPDIAYQPLGCEFDIEVLEMSKKNKAIRIANFGGDGIDLVEWGDGEAEHRSRRGGDFFHPGRVINPYSGNNDELDRRTLVVLSTTNNGYAECLALCRHPDHSGEERASFYNAHAAVYSSGDPPPTCHGKAKNEAIEIRFKSPSFKMSDSCYLNFEHTWTLRPDFPVMDLGYVRRDQRRRVLEVHLKIQTDLFNRNIEEHGLGAKLKTLGN